MLALTCALMGVSAGFAEDSEEGFVAIFDGKTLDGWKPTAENARNWEVVDGAIVAKGERSHLFYEGKLQPFKNFHFKGEVKTTPGSNSGIYFHTRYQPEGWPKYGYECQVNVTQGDEKKTSSLYAVSNVSAADLAKAGINDNEWYTQEIIVEGRHIVLKVNGTTMVDYTEPAGKEPDSAEFERRLGEGTFALQAHDPGSTVYYRNLRVKKLD